MTTQLHNISNTPLNEKNEWRTPLPVFRWAEALIGGFDFDTACTLNNRLAAAIYYVKSVDGFDALAVDWSGKCWCNPPYDNIDPWIEKAISSPAITAMLIPSPNGWARYSKLMQHAHEIVIAGCLAFLRPDGTPVSGNTSGSSLFIINGYAQGLRSFVERDWIMENFS